MRPVNVVVFNASTQTTKNSSVIDAEFLTSASVQISFTDGAAAGTLKVQVSNDHCASGNVAADFTPSNWNDLSGVSVTAAAGATSLIPVFNLSYRWLRLVWTSTGGAGTMTATLDAKELT